MLKMKKLLSAHYKDDHIFQNLLMKAFNTNGYKTLKFIAFGDTAT